MSFLDGLLGGGSAKVATYPFTLRATSTAETSSDEIGVCQFNADDWPEHTITFFANLEVAAEGQTATLELYNVFDGVTVATLTSTSTVTEKRTTEITLPALDKLYGVRLRRTGGDPTKRVACRSAGFELREG
jgi:hypothetical protein